MNWEITDDWLAGDDPASRRHISKLKKRRKNDFPLSNNLGAKVNEKIFYKSLNVCKNIKHWRASDTCPFYLKTSSNSSVGKESTCITGDLGHDSWVSKILWRRDKLPTPVFLVFPSGSASKESTCNAGDLGSIPGSERSTGEGKGYPFQCFWCGEFHGLYSPRGCRVRHEWVAFTFTFFHIQLLKVNVKLFTSPSWKSCKYAEENRPRQHGWWYRPSSSRPRTARAQVRLRAESVHCPDAL